MNLDELYQEIILDHFKNPRNAGELPEGTDFVEGINPNCGDVVQLTAQIDEEQLERIRYHAKGCAISIASASIMSEHLIALDPEAAQAAIDLFEKRIKDEDPSTYPEKEAMAALLTVRQFPMRLKCATLPWTAMREWLANVS